MFKKLGGALANAAKQQLTQAVNQQRPPQAQPQQQQQQQWQPPQQQWQPQPPPQVTPPAPQPPQGFPNPGEIWAFADPGYRGACSRLSVGDVPNLVALGINDNISSIRCGPNTYVDLFDDCGFVGIKQTFFGDVPSLGAFDNRASSLRIYTQDPVPTGAPPAGEAWLYSELNFGGTILRAVGDCPDLNVQRANDSIRSLRVGPATMVELFEHGNYGGRSKAWNTDDASLVDDGFDRAASSLRVRSVAQATASMPQMPQVPRGEVWLYAQPRFSGQSFRSIISCADMKLMGCDDMISSVRCGPGTAIEFAMDVNMGGQRQVFQGDAPDIGPFTRRASSFTITLDGQPQGAAAPQQYAGPQPGTGKRKALLIGINYVAEPRAALKGCWNDVENMRNHLMSLGYPPNNIRVQRDKPGEEAPTKANIQAGVRWLMEGAAPGDSLFMHYSGHGTQCASAAGKEVDSKNEALCPSDFRTAGLVEDDELNAIMVVPMKQGVRMTCVFDCCHSGTALDLPYTETANREAPLPRAVREQQLDAKSRALAGLKSAFVQGLAQWKQKQAGTRAGPGGGFNFNSLLQIGANVVKQQLLNPQELTPEQRQEAHRSNDGTSLAGQVVLISGCQDDQCSADAVFGGQPAGALTNAILGTIRERNGNVSWIELIYAARSKCGQGSIKQTPQISFNNPKFNLDEKLAW